MKVELSIKDDTELRNLIKDTIKEQVTSIVRDEIMDIIKEVVESKIVNQIGLEKLIRDLVREKVHSDLQNVSGYGYHGSFVRTEAKEQIAEILQKLFVGKDLLK